MGAIRSIIEERGVYEGQFILKSLNFTPVKGA
jgi:hypothetical protein